MKTSLIIALTHTTEAVVKLKTEKNSDLNGIQAHDFYDTCADNCDDQSCPHNPYYEVMFSLRCAQCACGLFPVR